MAQIRHEYDGVIYPSPHAANRAAVVDMIKDFDFDDLATLCEIEEMANELIVQGFVLPVFDTEVEYVCALIKEIVDDDHYHA